MSYLAKGAYFLHIHVHKFGDICSAAKNISCSKFDHLCKLGNKVKVTRQGHHNLIISLVPDVIASLVDLILIWFVVLQPSQHF